MPLATSLSGCWRRLQGELFPALAEELGPLGERHQQLVTVLELARPEAFIGHAHGAVGRPKSDRAALARSFLAKAVFNISETEARVERVIANFKDNFAGRLIRLRGPDKITCHITFAMTAIAAIQVIRLVQSPRPGIKCPAGCRKSRDNEPALPNFRHRHAWLSLSIEPVTLVHEI